MSPMHDTGGAAAYLSPDEGVLWSGRPARRGYLGRNNAASCFGAVFLAIALTATAILVGVFGFFTALMGQLPDGEQGFAPEYGLILAGIVGGILILTGLYLSVGQYVTSYLEWRRLRYVITDRRVVIYGGALRPRVTSLPLEHIPTVWAEDRGDGTADLVLGPHQPAGKIHVYAGRRRRGYSRPTSPALFAVPDAAEVAGILRAAVERARSGTRADVDGSRGGVVA
jgi:hypothetical protein